MIFLVPVIQLLVFGYAVTTDVRHIPPPSTIWTTASASRDLRARFIRIRLFRRRRVRARRPAGSATDRPRRGKAVLQMNRGFGDDLRRADRPAPAHRRRHRFEHGGDRPQLCRPIAGRFSTSSCRRGLARLIGVAGDTSRAGRPEAAPGSTRTWRAAISTCPASSPTLSAHHPAPDQHGGGPGKGDRHHGTDHGDAHHAARVHPRQDLPFALIGFVDVAWSR